MYIKRALEPVVAKYSEHFKIVVLTGPRQVGKTTMLRHLAKEEGSARASSPSRLSRRPNSLPGAWRHGRRGGRQELRRAGRPRG